MAVGVELQHRFAAGNGTGRDALTEVNRLLLEHLRVADARAGS
jgi:hypothetical protein